MFAVSQPNKRILVIDDDREIWKAYGQVLAPVAQNEDSSLQQISRLLASSVKPEAPQSFGVDFAAQGQEGFALAEAALAKGEPYGVAFIDVRMPPGWDGMETAARIRKIDPNVEIVIVTAYSDRSREEIVQAVGAIDKLLFIRKPFDAEELLQLAVSLAKKWQITRDEARHRSYLQAILRTSPAAIFTIDQQKNISSWNPAAERITGFDASEVVGKPCIFYDIAEESSCLQCQSGEEDFVGDLNCQISIHDKQGQKKLLVINVEHEEEALDPMVSMIGSFWDMTEMVALEEERRQSQKLNALGTLAGGIAHDLNNILTPILGYSQLALQQTESDSKKYAWLQVIESCAQKGAALIRQILAFTRKKTVKMASTDVNVVINDFAKMLRSLIREDIGLEFDLEHDLWPVLADQGQLEQVLVNLAVNARDAMVDSGGGAITFMTANVSLKENSCHDVSHQPVPAGDYVLLSVKDQGMGMDKELLEQIFDPFFTTKETGKGTGLGLSSIFGIVFHQHHGSICVESVLGQGSDFQIYLPRSMEVVVVDDHEVSLAGIDRGHQETLLLVDDNTEVLDMLSGVLQDLGYSVLTAVNGRDGLDVLSNHESDIDLIITDMIMPVMGGQAMAVNVRQRYPDLPILFITGFAFDAEACDITTMPHCDYVQKPFTMKGITDKIHEMLVDVAVQPSSGRT